MRKIVPKDALLIPDAAKLMFSGVIYDVYQWEQPNFDDSVAIFEMLKRPDTVSVICLVEGKIVVIQDDQPHRGLKLTLPGGRVDEEDKDILSAAKREVREETGYEFKEWNLVSVVQPFSKLEWFIYTFVAWDVAGRCDTSHDSGERITTHLETFDDFKALAIKDSGFLGEVRHIVESLKRYQELKQLSGYKGTIVDR
jgi:8-oxo-dGTP pyrophosphatase MutT (NUDIX family)